MSGFTSNTIKRQSHWFKLWNNGETGDTNIQLTVKTFIYHDKYQVWNLSTVGKGVLKFLNLCGAIYEQTFQVNYFSFQ